MGQRTTYLKVTSGGQFAVANVIINPHGVRTTFPISGMIGQTPKSSVDPFGNTTNYQMRLQFLLVGVNDARGVRTSFTYQMGNNAAYFLAGVQKTGFNSGTGIGQYSYFYNSNNQVKAVVDELGNRSTLVWDSLGNRIAVVDPYNKRTSYVYDSMGRLVGRAKRAGCSGRRSSTTARDAGRPTSIRLGHRTTYAYDINSQLLHVKDPSATSRPRCTTT